MKPAHPAEQVSHALARKPPLALVPQGEGHSLPVEPAAAAPAAGAADRAQRIRQAAYARYEARGRADGHALDDWLQAEAEVTAGPAGPGAGPHAG